MDTPNWIFPDHDTYNHCVTPNDVEEWQASQTPQKSCLHDTMQPAPSLPFEYGMPQLQFGNLAAHNTSQMHPQYVTEDVGYSGPHYAVDPSSGLRRSCELANSESFEFCS
ncbi:uncharacterized protein BJ212DRAFT_1591286 [Suillus subaureus]|uniref:Uncharacterized protein n=1 Tax=Suillus subaureus TaxID=48587 RepID=A0A9P7J4C5_9AGAM|nr:uncharacterized protein BJ212DRAFT_1591286 [Suillus subaureus]KAG1802528.1 hypothetical protein BJ212DRAFT_1591286 [Suillus subaureus]